MKALAPSHGNLPCKGPCLTRLVFSLKWNFAQALRALLPQKPHRGTCQHRSGRHPLVQATLNFAEQSVFDPTRLGTPQAALRKLPCSDFCRWDHYLRPTTRRTLTSYSYSYGSAQHLPKEGHPGTEPCHGILPNHCLLISLGRPTSCDRGGTRMFTTSN